MEDRIIEAATELFLQYGFKNVTMDDIANELAISKKTIYQSFKDKKEIVSKCTQKKMSREYEEFEEINKKAANAVEEMIIVSEHFRMMLRTMNPIVLYDLRKYFPEAWNIYASHRETCYRQSLLRTLKKGIEEGFFRADIDPEVLALMRMHQVELGFNPQVFPAKTYDIPYVQHQFTEHFMFGICTRKGLEYIEKYRALSFESN